MTVTTSVQGLPCSRSLARCAGSPGREGGGASRSWDGLGAARRGPPSRHSVQVPERTSSVAAMSAPEVQIVPVVYTATDDPPPAAADSGCITACFDSCCRCCCGGTDTPAPNDTAGQARCDSVNAGSKRAFYVAQGGLHANLRCAPLALAPLPLISPYTSEKSSCGAGF